MKNPSVIGHTIFLTTAITSFSTACIELIMQITQVAQLRNPFYAVALRILVQFIITFFIVYQSLHDAYLLGASDVDDDDEKEEEEEEEPIPTPIPIPTPSPSSPRKRKGGRPSQK